MINVVLTLSNAYSENQWDYILSNFAADNIYLLNGMEPTGKLLQAATRITTVDELPEIPLILLAPLQGRYIQGDESLVDFVHPADATYLFGSDKAHMEQELLGTRVPDHKVYVPTDDNTEMYSWTAYTSVVWDRRHG